MSAETVDLVRRLHARPDVDLAQLFRDDRAFAAAQSRLARFFDPDCEVAGAPGEIASTERTGLDGLREVWLEWLRPWASYRSEIEELMDIGDRVVVLVRDYGRLQAEGPEVKLTSGSIWTVRAQKVTRVEFHMSRESALQAAGLGG